MKHVKIVHLFSFFLFSIFLSCFIRTCFSPLYSYLLLYCSCFFSQSFSIASSSIFLCYVLWRCFQRKFFTVILKARCRTKLVSCHIQNIFLINHFLKFFSDIYFLFLSSHFSLSFTLKKFTEGEKLVCDVHANGSNRKRSIAADFFCVQVSYVLICYQQS